MVHSPRSELESEYDVVVSAPASCFFIGEYSVLYGKPALVMPIPVFLHMGMKLTKKGNLELDEFYRPSNLGFGERNEEYYRDEKTHTAFRSAIFRTIKDHVETQMHLSLNGLAIGTRSDIPARCGLGSSGAFSAATSVAVHVLLQPELAKEIVKWSQMSVGSLLSDTSFRSVFQLAWNLESVYHGRSSGCGPFASLVGSSDALPLVYSVLDYGSHKIYARRLSEFVKGDRELLVNTLWSGAGFALVFTGDERDSTARAISSTGEIANKVNSGLLRLQKQLAITNQTVDIPLELKQLLDLDSAKKKVDSDLWDTFGLIFIGWMTNLLSSDIEDLKRMVNLTQGLLSFLTVSTKPIDQFARDCNSGYDTACKITGSGKGGDVLLFGQKDYVMSCTKDLVKDRLSLHYASWLDSDEGHLVPGTNVVWTKLGPDSVPRALPSKADFALITAIEREQDAVNVALDAVKSAFKLTLDFVKKNNTEYFYGWVRSKSNPMKEHFVVCARCSTTGNQASQALTSAVLADWNPDNILLVGTAGGVQGRQEIQLCDVVVSSTIAYDKKKQTAGGWEAYSEPGKTPAAKFLRMANHVVDSRMQWYTNLGVKPFGDPEIPPKIVVEQIISGEDLRGDDKAQELGFLLKTYPRAVAVEMEGGGVSYFLWDSGSKTDFTVVKGITDYVNANPERNQKMRDLCRSYASKAAAALSFSLVEQTD
jgi:mevalonate kinase/nucleoside phosphorylase